MQRLPPPGRTQRSYARLALSIVAVLALPSAGSSQMVEEAVLNGVALLGADTLHSGTVVLHHMSDQTGGALDSVSVRSDGSFSLRLPSLPNPTLGDLYFASIRHDGVTYFGSAVTSAIQLDSVYDIQAYDTLLAPAEGVDVTLQARNIFLEPTTDAWQATDVFQLRNDRDRTVVARPGGRVWSYPLPEAARDVTTGEGEISPDVATYEDGDLVVRAALPPGERLFVVRYLLDSPEVSIPAPGLTELFDVLVREPAPPLDIEGMQQLESVELDPGQTFRHYAAEGVTGPFVRIVAGERVAPPPIHWIAVVLALVLATGGLLAWRAHVKTEPAPSDDRQALLVQLARLDERFESTAKPSRSETREYHRRRADLLRRVKTRT